MASSYTVKNESLFAIWVVMDSDREKYLIQPGGNTVFTRANIGDMPTFRCFGVLNDGSRGPQLAAKKVNWWNALRAGGTLKFNGASF